MRTTISLDDQLAKQVRRAADAGGLSVSAYISQVLNDAIKHRDPPDAPPFRLVTVRGAHPRPGVDLDSPRTLDVRDDEKRFGLRWQHPLKPTGGSSDRQTIGQSGWRARNCSVELAGRGSIGIIPS